MHRLFVFVLAVGFIALSLARADEKKDEKAKDEKGLKELEGTYKIVLAEKDGKAAEKMIMDMFTITIQGDEFISVFGSDDKKIAKIKVTPDPKLSTIDLLPQDGPEKGKTFPGIYKIEKGEITLVFTEKGDRPKEFKSDNDAILMRLKKVEK
jgi:uncharacterized protein (TIGR03067 family)